MFVCAVNDMCIVASAVIVRARCYVQTQKNEHFPNFP